MSRHVVSVMSPQSSFLIMPCRLCNAAQCLLRSSSMPVSSSAYGDPEGVCHGVGHPGRLAACVLQCGKAGVCVQRVLQRGQAGASHAKW